MLVVNSGIYNLKNIRCILYKQICVTLYELVVSNAYCVVCFFLFSSSCVPYVALHIFFNFPFGILYRLFARYYQCYQFLWVFLFSIGPSVFSNVYFQSITSVVVLNWTCFYHRIVSFYPNELNTRHNQTW